MNRLNARLGAGLLASAAGLAHATPTDDLRAFVRSVHDGRAAFTQTVTAPNGRQKLSHGDFAFARPGRFRFDYDKPDAQTLVGDGTQVWDYDPDLNQVTVRRMGDALGGTPAALLVSNDVDATFTLADLPSSNGLDWVQATPKRAEGTIRWVKAGFRGHALVELEIADSFGQHSVMRFEGLRTNLALPPDTFHFTPPPGADVASQ